MASTGLTQRKKPGATASTYSSEMFQSDDYQEDSYGRGNYGGTSTEPAPVSADVEASDFLADEDGFSDGDLEGKKVKLTLMEEILLLALRDQQGYYSWWNENLSYVLRGCMLIELSMRNRIAIFKETGGRHLKRSFSERLVEVVDDSSTGEVLLDEALKIIKTQQSSSSSNNRQSIAEWIDLLSGETWNVMKFSLQMKQVRERLLKGLVDKGVLRTEKKAFIVVEMTTHPLTDSSVKLEIIQRILNTLLGRGSTPTRRTIALCTAAYAANVMDNALGAAPSVGIQISYSQKDACFAKCEEMLVHWAESKSKSASNKNLNAISNSSDSIGGKDGAERARLGWTDVMTGVLEVFLKMDTVI